MAVFFQVADVLKKPIATPTESPKTPESSGIK